MLKGDAGGSLAQGQHKAGTQPIQGPLAQRTLPCTDQICRDVFVLPASHSNHEDKEEWLLVIIK
jgi:hypothetical protein